MMGAFVLALLDSDFTTMLFSVFVFANLFWYPVYILVNLIQMKLKKINFNYRLLVIPVLTWCFGCLSLTFIVSQQEASNMAVKEKLFKGSYCHVTSARSRITHRLFGVPQDYFLERDNHCLSLRSPSYSISKINHTYCGC